MDYEKKYKEALERAKDFHSRLDDQFQKEVENIFPELCKMEEERMRRLLIQIVNITPATIAVNNRSKLIAWLEKQGEQKCTAEEVLIKAGLKPYKDGNQWCILLGDNIQEGICGFGDTIDDALYAFLNDLIKSKKEQNPAMIQWKGDNLKEVIGFTGKDKNFDKWFTSFEEYERYVYEHNNIFKIFNEDGSHIEVPVGAWIVKTPDGYNTASRYVFRQKPVKVPKFKIGDFIQFNGMGHTRYTIKEVCGLSHYINSFDKRMNMSYTDANFELVEQKPAEWSEEDEKIMNITLCIISDFRNVYKDSKEAQKDADKIEDWLKSLRPQKHWKPSKEQLDALDFFIDCVVPDEFNYKKAHLKQLLNQLKKL
jgi:hypothetical protein